MIIRIVSNTASLQGGAVVVEPEREVFSGDPASALEFLSLLGDGPSVTVEIVRDGRVVAARSCMNKPGLRDWLSQQSGREDQDNV